MACLHHADTGSLLYRVMHATPAHRGNGPLKLFVLSPSLTAEIWGVLKIDSM